VVKTWSRPTPVTSVGGLLVLVCGSREWRDVETVRARLRDLPRGSAIVHGYCRGADQIAAQIARSLGITEEGYPAQWRTLGRRAGIVRNLALLDMCPDLVVAFWDGRSTGTRHVVETARARGIAVEVIREAIA